MKWVVKVYAWFKEIPFAKAYAKFKVWFRETALGRIIDRFARFFILTAITAFVSNWALGTELIPVLQSSLSVALIAIIDKAKNEWLAYSRSELDKFNSDITVGPASAIKPRKHR